MLSSQQIDRNQSCWLNLTYKLQTNIRLKSQQPANHSVQWHTIWHPQPTGHNSHHSTQEFNFSRKPGSYRLWSRFRSETRIDNLVVSLSVHQSVYLNMYSWLTIEARARNNLTRNFEALTYPLILFPSLYIYIKWLILPTQLLGVSCMCQRVVDSVGPTWHVCLQ